MTDFEENQKIAKRIEEACLDIGLDKRSSVDIGFHMTDWIEDNVALMQMYKEIDVLSDDQIRSVLMLFLAHVPEHVAAARKLIGLGELVDIFEVGIYRKMTGNINDMLDFKAGNDDRSYDDDVSTEKK